MTNNKETEKRDEPSESVQQKLMAFAEMRDEFMSSFRFLQDVQGQQRFEVFSVADVVRYLHARWICECKGRVLSVAKTTKEYEGRLCLELLRNWQEGDTASVVDFLDQRLGMLPLVVITRQIQALDESQHESGVYERLFHGRMIMLHQEMNLMHLLDAIFSLPNNQLLQLVHEACQQYGHTSEQIAQQLAEMNSPLFEYIPHQVLAQQNMLVMNMVATEALTIPDDVPGKRTNAVVASTEPMPPLAEEVIKGYEELNTPNHNNIKQDKFVDQPEQDETGETV